LGDLLVVVLITGATGHVGSVLTRKAVQAGLDVVAIVRSPDRVDPSTADSLGPRVTWAACDLNDPFQIAAVPILPV